MLLFNVKSFPGHYPMSNIRKLEKKNCYSHIFAIRVFILWMEVDKNK
jgi:hypothetical protein